MRFGCVCWLLIAWVVGSGVAFAQVDDDAAKKDEDDDRPLKLTLRQAVYLQVVDGKLLADSKLKGARLVDQAVEVEELGGSSTLTLKPEFLRFENTRSVSDGVETLRIENRNEIVTIRRDGGDATVYYRESSGGFGAFGNDGVRMSVYGRDGTMLHSLTANDFETLKREHRAEVFQYLGPVLRLLRTEGVIGADQRIAKQVLMPRRMMREVEPIVMKLIAQLDSDSFRERGAALAKMKELGPDAIAVVERINLKKLSPQQLTGIEAFLSDTRLASLQELDRLKKDAQFLIECLYCEDVKIRMAAVERLAGLNRGPVGVDAKADPLGQAGVIEELRGKLVGAAATRPAKP